MSIPFSSIVRSLPDTIPFIGPETLERKYRKPFRARIGANESAFGISPYAREAIQQAAGSSDCSWYADPENHDLRTLLCAKHNVSMENLCVDAGIDSLLGLTVRMFIEPGISMVTSKGAYPTVNYHANGYGASIRSVPYKDHSEDPVALIDAAHTHHARLIYLANPDNPMGTCLSPDIIHTMLKELPADCLLMLDEAYVEFMDDMPVLPIDIDDPRLIRFRTFSKAYGMAGMRIGYVIAHADIIAGFNRIRNHFGVNRLAQIAAAASLQDSAFIPDVVNLVRQGRQRIYDLAESLSLDYLPSSTNFVAVDLGKQETANAIIAALADRGVFMRKPMVTPQDRFIRIGVGTNEEHQHLENMLIPLIRAR
ncbi:MAG: aminotransferase class I/II-fold pyridoxal phosphate-dependent enzyme [Granulosicoccus sp.]